MGSGAATIAFFDSGPYTLVGRMGGNDQMQAYSNRSVWPAMTLLGSSAVWFGVYIGKVTNSHEWKELFLDYYHHKRTVYSSTPFDKIARTVLKVLKVTPK